MNKIKSLWYNEKWRSLIIISITVLVVVSIMLPFILLGGRGIKGGFKSYLYNSSTATASRMNNWMKIPKTDVGDGTSSYDLTIVNNNPEYAKFVLTDEQMLSGVKSTNSIGYLSKNKIIELNPNGFTYLKAYNDETNEYVDSSDDNYPIPTAPLDIVLKIPGSATKVFKDQLISYSKIDSNGTLDDRQTGLIWTDSFDAEYAANEILNSTGELKDYYNWIYSNKFEWDLFISFAFFNYVSFSKEAISRINNPIYSEQYTFKNFVPEEYKIDDATLSDNFKNYFLNTKKLFDELGLENNPIIIDNIYNSTKFSIIISGSGTVIPLMEIYRDSYNEFLNNNFSKGNEKIEFTYTLINRGSGASWIVPDELDNESWVEGSGLINDDYDVSINSFIGLQSRKSNQSEIKNWHLGYGEKNNTFNSDDLYEIWINEDSDDVSNWEEEDYYNLPIGTTLGTETTVFFVPLNQKYEINNKEYYFTGISSEGAKLIYLKALTPIEIYNLGYAEFTPV